MVSLEEIREIARRRGWELVGIRHLKHRDRIVLRRGFITQTLYLKTRIENISKEELEAIMG